MNVLRVVIGLIAPALAAAGPLDQPHRPWCGTGAHPHTRVGTLVWIGDLPDVQRPTGPAPTTAALAARRHPGPDRTLPGGLRITTRCDDGCCVDGLMAGDRALFEPKMDADDRRTCRAGWFERVVRVAYQDESAVSIYVAQSWFADGAAHANNRLQCRSFDLATRRPLNLRDVAGAGATEALARARRTLQGSFDYRRFTPTATGIRFRGGKPGGRELLFCAEGPYPGDSSAIVELDAR